MHRSSNALRNILSRRLYRDCKIDPIFRRCISSAGFYPNRMIYQARTSQARNAICHKDHSICNQIRCNSTEHDSNEFRGYSLSSPECNIPETIASRIGTNLHLQPKHPLNTIKTIIEDYWQQRNGFVTRDDLDPIVPTMNNFDSLLIPPDHVSRSKSDTYYFDKETVLRTHTSAHQTNMLIDGEDRFLVTGDVYR